MKKSHDKLATRLIDILTKLNSGYRLTINELAQEFNVDIRTIQRDINERLSYLPIKKENGFYSIEPYALGKLSFEDIKNFATISGIKSLYPQLSDTFIRNILNTKINTAYLVKTKGFEKLEDKASEFEQISAAVLNCYKISFNYNDKNRIANPYKIVNNNGIWYVVAEEEGQLKTYGFKKIKNLQISKTIFKPNPNSTNTINKNELNWFSQDEIEVTLEIDNKISEYFLRRNLLTNQTIIEHTQTKLILSTKVSYDDEIIATVKYWLPHIKIISPSHLQEKLEKILREYLE